MATDSLTYDEPKHISVTGVDRNTGSTKKYSEVVDKVEVEVNTTSKIIRGFNDGEKVFSGWFKQVDQVNVEIAELMAELSEKE